MEYLYKLSGSIVRTTRVNNIARTGVIMDTVTGRKRFVTESEVFGIQPINAVILESGTGVSIETSKCSVVLDLSFDSRGAYRLTVSKKVGGGKHLLNSFIFGGFDRVLSITGLARGTQGEIIFYLNIAGNTGRVTVVPSGEEPRANLISVLDIVISGIL